jgi:hypothetical protein
MESFDYSGKTYVFGEDEYAIDINVPTTVTNIAFTDENVTANCPDDVDVDVTLAPPSGAVSAGAPCVATVTITSKTYPTKLKKTYTINFGYVTAEKLNASRIDGVWNIDATVRFSDGGSCRLISVSEKQTDAIDVSKSGLISDTFAAVGDRGETTTKIFLWDQDFAPIAPAYVRVPEIETEVWRQVPNAAAIVAGGDYIIVSSSGNRALTNATGTVTGTTVGFTPTTVSVSADGMYITSEPPDNIIWRASTDGAGLRFQSLGGTAATLGGSNYLGRTASGTYTAGNFAMGGTTTNTQYRYTFYNNTQANGGVAMQQQSGNYLVNGTLTGGFATYFLTAAPTDANRNTYALKVYQKVIEIRPVTP